MNLSAAPPTPQEIQRKLSVHSATRPPKPQAPSHASISGTESDSDSIMTPDPYTSGFPSSPGSSQLNSGPGSGAGGYMVQPSTSASSATAAMLQQPLSSIAEPGEDSEEEDDEEEGGWKSATPTQTLDESVIKTGYLWKKGERRKTWKKRWFVLRPAHLAYYKTSAEYKLLRLLDLSDIHSCTQVSLKRHDNTFGLVSPVRTYYLQTKTSPEVQEWVAAIEKARQALAATSTQSSLTSMPIPIPTSSNAGNRVRSNSRSTNPIPTITPSPPSHLSYRSNMTSSDSEDGLSSPQPPGKVLSGAMVNSPGKAATTTGFAGPGVGSEKTILSGYLMKRGKRKNWSKRFFVLSGDKLSYYSSHMNLKSHHQDFQLQEIVDALEYTKTSSHKSKDKEGAQSPILGGSLSGGGGSGSVPASDSAGGDTTLHHDAGGGARTFKIVTTKRTLLLCAPNEEEEIRWLGAIRALIARRTAAGEVAGSVGKALSTSGVPSGAGGVGAASVTGAGGGGGGSGGGSAGGSGVPTVVTSGLSEGSGGGMLRSQARRMSGSG